MFLKTFVRKLGIIMNIPNARTIERINANTISASAALSLKIFSNKLILGSATSSSSKNSAEYISALVPISIASISPTTPLINGRVKNLYFIPNVSSSSTFTSISPSGFLTAIEIFSGPLIITPSIRA